MHIRIPLTNTCATTAHIDGYHCHVVCLTTALYVSYTVVVMVALYTYYTVVVCTVRIQCTYTQYLYVV
jgi:hypothetical protein